MKRPKDATGRLADPSDRDPADPGSAICPTTHANRIHALGGGMFVCFECMVRLVCGGGVR